MCTHTRKESGRWERNPNAFYEEAEMEWVEGSEVSTTVDIDTHRYKCTQCGEVMYYSAAAREYYEKGTPSHVLGLGV